LVLSLSLFLGLVGAFFPLLSFPETEFLIGCGRFSRSFKFVLSEGPTSLLQVFVAVDFFGFRGEAIFEVEYISELVNILVGTSAIISHFFVKALFLKFFDSR